eukprot:COSAG01_NODE_52357_length_347_cov_0.725806_1_plen_50_part_10
MAAGLRWLDLFNAPAATEIYTIAYTLSLLDALPVYGHGTWLHMPAAWHRS